MNEQIQTVYYCPEIFGNFFELKDALSAAAAESIRTGEECAVIVNTGTNTTLTAISVKGSSMNEQMQELCKEHNVNFSDIQEMLNQGLIHLDNNRAPYAILHFSLGELKVLKAALEIAGGL